MMAARYTTPDELGRVGLTAPGDGVWARVPLAAVVAARWDRGAGVVLLGRLVGPAARAYVRLRVLLGEPDHVAVAVPPAPLGVGLAVHALARDVLAEGPGTGPVRRSFDAVVAGWLPAPLPGALAALPAVEAVAATLALLDGDPPAASDLDDGPAGPLDWLLTLTRFAEGAGVSVAQALQTVPWRAFADHAARVEVLRATRLRDAALAAAAGFGGGDAGDAVAEAVARAYARAGLDGAAASSPERVAAGRARIGQLFGFAVGEDTGATA